jgi:prenyltransferase beta subunit
MKHPRASVFAGIAIVVIIFLASASPAAAITRKNAVVNFISSCISPDYQGYYASSVVGNGGEVPSLESTYYAIQTLNMLDNGLTNSSFKDSSNITTFLNTLQNSTDGGYWNFVSNGSETVMNTFYALYLYEKLDPLESTTFSTLNIEKQTAFVEKSWDNLTGGFGQNPLSNSTPDIFSTYYALEALTIAGNESTFLNKTAMTQLTSFMSSCEQPSHLFSSQPNSTDTSLVTTEYAVDIYSQFLPKVFATIKPNVTIAVENQISAYNSPNGGTNGFPDTAVDPNATIASTSDILNATTTLGISIQASGSLDTWVLSHQNYDGGFVEGSPGLTQSSMAATYYAVVALYLHDAGLGKLGANSPWTIVQIGGIVAAIVIIAAVIVLIVVYRYIKNKNKV